MHELGITQEVVAIATEHAGGRPVKRVVLEIGTLAGVLPDAVRFCFDLCAAGTPVQGAALEIVETPGRGRCRTCAGDVILSTPLGRCNCGGTDLEWVAGMELRVKELEVA